MNSEGKEEKPSTKSSDINSLLKSRREFTSVFNFVYKKSDKCMQMITLPINHTG